MTPRVELMFLSLFAAAWAAMACDDAVSRPPEAAVALALNFDETATEGDCKAVGSNSLPLGPNGQVLRLSSNTQTEDLKELPRVKDGVDGATVKCTVTETDPVAGAFTVSAELRSSGEGKSFEIKNASVAGGMGGGTISWISPDIPAIMSSSVCTLSVDEQIEGGGAIQLTFQCPQFRNQSQPDFVCKATGTVVLERCDK